MQWRIGVGLGWLLLPAVALAQGSFAEADADRSGYVERDEFGAGGPVQALADETFDEWDTNDDGRLDEREWNAAVRVDGGRKPSG